MTLSIGTSLLLASLGSAAGILGALVGIGGGVILVPALVIGFGLEMRDAVAASLVSIVATSTATGSVYVREGRANMRLAMTLEIATTLGGMLGGLLALAVPTTFLAGLFAAILTVTALLLVRPHEGAHGSAEVSGNEEPSLGSEERGRLAGAYRDAQNVVVRYEATRLPLGMGISLFAGSMSGMLGVGGGFLKVPAMVLGMRVPMHVAAATSNFMIGVTALASLSVYFFRGYLRPLLAGPIVLGVIVGSILGSKLSRHVGVHLLRVVLALVLVLVAIEMALRAFGVDLAW